MMYLQEFDFNTVFQAGKTNIGDYLSRHTSPSNIDKTPGTMCKKCNFEEDVVKTVIYLFKTTVQNAIAVEDIKQETAKDDVLQNLIKIVRHGNWTSYKQDLRYKPFFMLCDELSIVDDMVVKGSRIVMPQDELARRIDYISVGLSKYTTPSTGKSSNELVIRYPIHTSLPRVMPPIEDQDVRERDAFQKMQMKDNLEKRKKITRSSPEIGQPVLVRQRKGNKLTPKFQHSL